MHYQLSMITIILHFLAFDNLLQSSTEEDMEWRHSLAEATSCTIPYNSISISFIMLFLPWCPWPQQNRSEDRSLHKDSSLTKSNELVIINPRNTGAFANANFVGLLQKTVIVLWLSLTSWTVFDLHKYFHTSLNLWWKWKSSHWPLNLWQEMWRTLQVRLRWTLTSLDYRISTEALRGQEIMR